MNIFLSILSIIVMIILHEWGHFIAARICKVPVYEFAVGFGPKLFSFKSKKKETVYSIRAIPLGGFCSFDNISESDTINGITDLALEKIPIYKKVFISFMGPFVNILCGFLLVFGCITSFGITESYNKIAGFSENRGNISEYLEIGDEIIEVDGLDVSARNETILSEYLTNEFKGETIHVKAIKNDGSIKEYDIKPYYDEELGRYFIGFKLSFETRKPGLFEAIKISAQSTGEVITGVFNTLTGLFSRKYSLQDTAGIVGTVVIMSEYAKPEFLESFLALISYISINLGVMNLLPIPPLDGFKILESGIELIRRKKMKEKTVVILTTVSFGILLIFSLILILVDVGRILQ